MAECLICNRIKLIREKKNRYFVKELETGYVVLGDYQFYKGYTLFLGKKHVTELHELDDAYRKNFLYEMSLVAKAVYQAFTPEKLNYELLGNAVPHLHWHLFPRYKDDPQPNKPIWAIDKATRCNDSTLASDKDLYHFKELLLKQNLF